MSPRPPVAMAYDDEGAGDAVALLHSGVCDRRMWQPQAAALSASSRVLRPDLRGFGETPLPPGEFSYAEDVVEWLQRLSVERCVLVASSMGGQVSLEVAASRPDLVSGLVLLCSAYRGLPPGPDVLGFGEEEDRLLEAGDVEAAVELNVSTWLGPEADAGTLDLVREMQRRAFDVQLAADGLDPVPEPVALDIDPGAISAPTLVVSGGRDLAHFRRVAEHLVGAIADAEHVELPWAGHLPSLERPGAVTELLAGFVATCR